MPLLGHFGSAVGTPWGVLAPISFDLEGSWSSVSGLVAPMLVPPLERVGVCLLFCFIAPAAR